MASGAAGAGDPPDENDSTLHLRIVAVFVILVGGLLGSTPPLFIEAFKRPDNATTRVVRAFVAGVSPPATCCSRRELDGRGPWPRAWGQHGCHLDLSAVAAVAVHSATRLCVVATPACVGLGAWLVA